MRDYIFSLLTLKWFWILIAIVTVPIIIDKFTPKDDTDPVSGRSGFNLMIDKRTGCQYLQAGVFGGITPRLDRNGRHICE